jgi:nucleotide-binding universal stress UspA family protein
MEGQMALKDILVCLGSTAAGDGRMKLAVGLAHATKAHLTAAYLFPEARGGPSNLSATSLPVVSDRAVIGLAGGGLAVGDMPPAPLAPQAAHDAERAETVEERFRGELRLAGIDGGWYLFASGEGPELIELAKTVDLAITGQLSPEFRSTGFRPEDIAVAAARPVLVVPYAGTFGAIGRRALIAWDGTREAVRAVNDALPLLANAEAATVTFVGAQQAALDRQRPSLERIVRHLQRHGIAAKAEEALQGGIAISDVLLSRAADLDADLIVAGVYHHSQLREALIGGVSRELLEHMTVPVLMAH